MPDLANLDALFAFFAVFVRCGAAFISSPLFGAQNTPMPVRIFTAMALSGAIAMSVSAKIGPAPAHMGGLLMALLNEVAAGLFIGLMFQFVIQIATMAGSFLDMQVGLSMSQSMNPVTGVPVSVIGQFKTMLGMVVFLSLNGHHYVLQAIVKSYNVAPTLTASDMGLIHNGVITMLSQGCLVAIQIAAPVLGVSMIVDAALGAMSKALPQFQPLQIGMPAKLALGISAVSLTLPAIVSATSASVERSFQFVGKVFGG